MRAGWFLVPSGADNETGRQGDRDMNAAELNQYRKIRAKGYTARTALAAVRDNRKIKDAWMHWDLEVWFEPDYDVSGSDFDCGYADDQEFWIMCVGEDGHMMGCIGAMDSDDMANPYVLEVAAELVDEAIRELNCGTMIIDAV